LRYSGITLTGVKYKDAQGEWASKMKKIIVVLLLSLAPACSTAGPFVTGVSSDGDGGLLVEKCCVQMNGFTGTIHNQNCSSSKVQLARKDVSGN